jgi:hypothetical protein
MDLDGVDLDGVDLDGVDLAGLDSQFQNFGLDWIERSGASWSANGPFLIRKDVSENSTFCFRHIVPHDALLRLPSIGTLIFGRESMAGSNPRTRLTLMRAACWPDLVSIYRSGHELS